MRFNRELKGEHPRERGSTEKEFIESIDEKMRANSLSLFFFIHIYLQKS